MEHRPRLEWCIDPNFLEAASRRAEHSEFGASRGRAVGERTLADALGKPVGLAV